ncbi:MAG: DUF4230 domain-containing protein [Actinomycetota bacterium]|nr:DUF4230 domain-containing protein [Actinomycetota bacterium]
MGGGKKGSGLGTTLVLALVIVVLTMLLGVGLANYGEKLPLLGPLFVEEPARTTTSPVVVEGIQELDRLATVRWTESVVVTRESGGTRLEQVLTGERVLLVATGEVEAGVDLAEMDEDDVRVDGDRVTIDLPEPQILSSSLDEERTRVYDRDQGLLNLGADDVLVQEARRDAEAEVVSTAEENGILETAERNAEESIRAFVTTLGFEEVEFVG